MVRQVASCLLKRSPLQLAKRSRPLPAKDARFPITGCGLDDPTSARQPGVRSFSVISSPRVRCAVLPARRRSCIADHSHDQGKALRSRRGLCRLIVAIDSPLSARSWPSTPSYTNPIRTRAPSQRTESYAPFSLRWFGPVSGSSSATFHLPSAASRAQSSTPYRSPRTPAPELHLALAPIPKRQWAELEEQTPVAFSAFHCIPS